MNVDELRLPRTAAFPVASIRALDQESVGLSPIYCGPCCGPRRGAYRACMVLSGTGRACSTARTKMAARRGRPLHLALSPADGAAALKSRPSPPMRRQLGNSSGPMDVRAWPEPQLSSSIAISARRSRSARALEARGHDHSRMRGGALGDGGLGGGDLVDLRRLRRRLVGLGQHHLVAHRRLVELVHHRQVIGLGAVPAIDQHIDAAQVGAAGEILSGSAWSRPRPCPWAPWHSHSRACRRCAAARSGSRRC